METYTKNQKLVEKYFSLRNELISLESRVKWIEHRGDHDQLSELKEDISSTAEEFEAVKLELKARDLPAVQIHDTIMAQIQKYIRNIKDITERWNGVMFPDLNQGLIIDHVIEANLIRDIQGAISGPGGVNIPRLMMSSKKWDVSLLLDFLTEQFEEVRLSQFNSTMDALEFFESFLTKINDLMKEIDKTKE